MFQTTHEKFYLMLDALEDNGFITTCLDGYRLSQDAWKSYMKNKSNLEETIKNMFYESYSTPIHSPPVIDIYSEKGGEGGKQGSFPKTPSLKFSGNLAWDIVVAIFWSLAGNVNKKRFVTTDEFLCHLSKGWVLID